MYDILLLLLLLWGSLGYAASDQRLLAARCGRTAAIQNERPPPTPPPRWLSEILDGSRTPPRPASSRCPYSRHLHPAVRWPSAETRWHPGHSQLALTPAGRLGIGRPAWPPTLDPTAAARSATEAHLPRHTPDSDPPRPRPYLALPSAGQRTADGWRGLVRRAVC